MDYLYDGTFEGLLTSVYYSYYEEEADGIYPEDMYQYSIIHQSRVVTTDPALSSRVYEAIHNKISPLALKQVYYVFLSNHPRKENLILNYLLTGFKLGRKVTGYHTHPHVLPVQNMAHKVSLEAHRFFGLTRFIDTGRFLYAPLEPDHDILILLAEHFADRLAQENFVLHDKRRNIAAIYDRKEWYLSDCTLPSGFTVSESETFYQELWARYFTHIGIETRKNIRLQNQFIPQRYRKNITEFTKPLQP